ncbi:OTU domain-containing protein 6A-like isoform X1 [Equus przewalskii]|uniref:Uncharacterized protein n=2 Tax=Equus TaxID=9789 RepID=A0A3Q2I5S4_HORSE
MVRRHHLEKKELQARPRSDRKGRKQLLLDVAGLEATTEPRHQQELEKLQKNFPDDSNLDSVTEDLAKMDLEAQPPRLSRAQRRRERRGGVRGSGPSFAVTRERSLPPSWRPRLERWRRSSWRPLHVPRRPRPAGVLGNGEPAAPPADGLRKHGGGDFRPFFSDSENGDADSRDDFLGSCDIVRARRGEARSAEGLSRVLRAPIEGIQAHSPVPVPGRSTPTRRGSSAPCASPDPGSAAPRLFQALLGPMVLRSPPPVLSPSPPPPLELKPPLRLLTTRSLQKASRDVQRLWKLPGSS